MPATSRISAKGAEHTTSRHKHVWQPKPSGGSFSCASGSGFEQTQVPLVEQFSLRFYCFPGLTVGPQPRTPTNKKLPGGKAVELTGFGQSLVETIRG